MRQTKTSISTRPTCHHKGNTAESARKVFH